MQRTVSPSTDDGSIEQEIVARGLTAPRITPSDVEGNIVSAHYFTAADGVMAGVTATPTARRKSRPKRSSC